MGRRAAKDKPYKTCGYCEHLMTGSVTGQGRICGKEFITDATTDARECHYFSIGRSMACRASNTMIDLSVCLSRQDNGSTYCPSRCDQGKLSRALFIEFFGQEGEIGVKKCKNPNCSSTPPAYRDYCCLQCWSDHQSGFVVNRHKEQEGEPIVLSKEPPKKSTRLKRITLPEAVAKQSKLRRIAYAETEKKSSRL